MTPELAAACRRAVHVISADGRVFRAGRAVLFIASELGWPRLSRLLALPPMVWLVEAGYFVVARNRGFFGHFMLTNEQDDHPRDRQ